MKRLLPLALVALALAAGCSRQDPVAEPPRPVGVEQAKPLSGDAGRRYTATLLPREQVAMVFRVGGYVEDILTLPGANGQKVLVERGQKIRKGQVLARLRTVDYQARVTAARAALDEASVTRNQAVTDLKRLEALLRANAVAQAEYDRAKEKHDAAVTRVEAAASQLAGAQVSLQDATLVAPFDGIIERRDVERGALVGPGAAAFVVADLTVMKAVFGVPDVLLDTVRVGDRLGLRLETAGIERVGVVRAIAPAADQRSRVFEIEIDVPNGDGALKDGMTATVQLGAGRAGGAPSVPLRALVRPAGASEGYAVYVVEQREGHDVAVARLVRLGAVQGSRVELVEGVAQGERVITTGATIMRTGDRVRILPGEGGEDVKQ